MWKLFVVRVMEKVWDELNDDEACSIVNYYVSQVHDLHRLSAVLRDCAFALGSDDNISVMIIKL